MPRANRKPGLHGGVQRWRCHGLERPLRQHTRHEGAPARQLPSRLPVPATPAQPVARYSLPQLGQKRSTCFQCRIRYAFYVINEKKNTYTPCTHTKRMKKKKKKKRGALYTTPTCIYIRCRDVLYIVALYMCAARVYRVFAL